MNDYAMFISYQHLDAASASLSGLSLRLLLRLKPIKLLLSL